MMNAVGIDVSKGKSTVAILRPYDEVVASPFDVAHTGSDLKLLADAIKKLPGETRVVMDATGNYFEPIAYFGYDSENDDSGQKNSKSNPMTKKGSSALRRTLFIIMQVLLQTKPQDNTVYDFLIKKQSEGKHYYSYMNDASNKFLRIYYGLKKFWTLEKLRHNCLFIDFEPEASQARRSHLTDLLIFF